MMKKEYEGCVASNMVVVGVDEYDKTEMRGRLYHFYMDEPDGVEFSGVISMLQLMDDFFDSLHMPMRSMEKRYFVNRKTKNGNGEGRTAVTRNREMAVTDENADVQPPHMEEVKNMAIKPGERATFVVHVCYRQNASWQGTVLWADEKKKVNFRSALELIKLMDNALEETGKD